jgi:hypothetical protein
LTIALHVARRASFNTVRKGKTDLIRFNNPTAVVVAGLAAINPSSGPILDSFLEAGWVPAVVGLLKESTCPLTLASQPSW